MVDDNSFSVQVLSSCIKQLIYEKQNFGLIGKPKAKKDVLWKPLLRSFRSYFRSRIHSSIDLNLSVQGVDAEAMYVQLSGQTRALLLEIGASHVQANNILNQHALIVLVTPAAAKNMFQALQNLPQV